MKKYKTGDTGIWEFYNDATRINVKPTTDKAECLIKALSYAKKIIRNYELDIRNSDWTGVDLESKGFCQGVIYKEALEHIKKLENGEIEE